jgi:cbb3-type cytochrome oxidase subunit 3
MLYRVCEHYDDQQIIQEQRNECFICFEYKTSFEFRPTNLQKQQIYFNNCICNGSVHNSCLKIWFDKNNSCPICRINVVENNKVTIIIRNYVPWGIEIYLLAKNSYIRFIKFFLVILFFHTFIYFCLIAFKLKKSQHNDYKYTSMPILEDDNINNILN